jgi:hypothetical protein
MYVHGGRSGGVRNGQETMRIVLFCETTLNHLGNSFSEAFVPPLPFYRTSISTHSTLMRTSEDCFLDHIFIITFMVVMIFLLIVQERFSKLIFSHTGSRAVPRL